MNKKQLIVALVAGILIVIYLGMGFEHTDIFSPDRTNFRPIGYIVHIPIYGKNVGIDIPMDSKPIFSLYPPFKPLTKLVWFLLNPSHLIIITVLIGGFLIYILRNKKEKPKAKEQFR